MTYSLNSKHYITHIRKTNPLIHNITNIVVANYVANGLLAIGASPIMADALEEMEELAKISSALTINIGTLDNIKVQSMLLAGKSANMTHIPIVLDPVGVGATQFRQKITQQLLEEIQFTAIRGNAGELAHLAGIKWLAKGVDAGLGSEHLLAEIAQTVAQKYKCIAAVSGEIDYISDGTRIIKIFNESPLFPKITGSGCLLGAFMGAFLAIEPKALDAVVYASSAYAIAGELASHGLKPTAHGQFYIRLLDQLAQIEDITVHQQARIEIQGEEYV